MRWREAMECGLYGPDGFFTRPGPGPAGHFRTSVHASPAFAGAIAELVGRLDTALDHPDTLDLIDVGGGRGELVTALQRALPEKINSRVRATVVELAPRPAGLPGSVGWTSTVPDRVTGLLIATEWLDNVPLDVVEVDDSGAARYVLVDPDGTERLGPPVEADDAAWLARWWPLDGAPPGTRAEVGAPRDAAWAGAVGALARGVALAVDYGHLRADRPAFGTLTGYRDGRQVTPVPDGSCDLTAHVAIDAVAAAPDVPSGLFTQRAALRALGVDGGRPPLELAYRDPQRYLAALARAGAAAELTDPAGLGGHYWLLHLMDAPLPAVIPGVR
jgi:SAM-dependent MidA family methyltransferase